MQSLVFSVRNDGSFETLLGLFPDDDEVRKKVLEVADPGLLIPPSRCHMSLQDSPAHMRFRAGAGGFEMAWNAGGDINKGRFPRGVEELTQYVAATKLALIPHCPEKDYNFIALTGHPEKATVNQTWFRDHIRFEYHATLFEALYQGIEAEIVMRGHGLYISVGLNIPSIVLSTQDKVLGFAKACGLDNYTVDTQANETYIHLLRHKMNELNHNSDYRKAWHDKQSYCLDRWVSVQSKFHAQLLDVFLRYAHTSKG